MAQKAKKAGNDCKNPGENIKRDEIISKAVDSALNLAAEKGWANVSMYDIAHRSDIKLLQLRSCFDDKNAIIATFEQMIDKKLQLEAGKYTQEQEDIHIVDSATIRERLFDLLMDRFEALNEHRNGIIAIIESCRYEPRQILDILPNLYNSMEMILSAAGEDISGIKGKIKIAALTGIYIKLLRVWKSDNSPDLPKTMAALDRALGKADMLLNTFESKII